MPSNRFLELLTAFAVTTGIVCQGCAAGGHSTEVKVIDHATARPADDPLDLVVGIDTTGKLTLNEIEIGTLADLAVLNKKIEAIFEDRRRASIDETEISIEITGPVAFDDVNTLIGSLRSLRPSRITVLTR